MRPASKLTASSAFGRTVRQYGTGGTDQGREGAMLVQVTAVQRVGRAGPV